MDVPTRINLKGEGENMNSGSKALAQRAIPGIIVSMGMTRWPVSQRKRSVVPQRPRLVDPHPIPIV